MQSGEGKYHYARVRDQAGGGGVSQPKRIVRSGSMKNKGGNADNSTKMANIRGKR